MDLLLLDLQCFDGLPRTIDSSETYVGPDAEDPLAGASENADDSLKALLILFGRSAEGQSVCVRVKGYKPWSRLLYRGPSKDLKTIEGQLKVALLATTGLTYSDISVQASMMPKFYGYEGTALHSKEYPCFKVYLPTFKSISRLEYACKSKRNREFEANWDLVDSAVPSAVKVMNELVLEPSSWFRIEKAIATSTRCSTCTLEVESDLACLKGLPENCTIAPLKIVSFDAEMFSHDNNFPQVIHGDFTIAICASVMIYGQKQAIRSRHAFVLWQESYPSLGFIEGLAVHLCESPDDLFEQFRDFVVSEDPDLLTGWNIYGFDMPFLWDSYQSSYLQPRKRGSEKLHMDLLQTLGRTCQSVSSLLVKYKRKFTEINSLALRHKLALKDPANLPESVAGPLRQTVRGSLAMGPEQGFVGPQDLVELRKMPEGPLKSLFANTIDKPQATGIKRAEFIGRFVAQRSVLDEKRMSSAAKGDNCYYFWSGRTCVDLMQIIKDDKKLEDNSLKFAAQTFLDPEFGKLDMTPAEMFKAYRTRDASGMTRMLEYCMRDADIPLLLIQKLSYVPLWIEMSRVTFTSLHQVLNGGQQRKVFNLISHFVHSTHVLNEPLSEWPVSECDTDDDDDDADASRRKPDYQGATVIEPKCGFYTDSVSTLDFESLYPSIIIHFNLCPSVYIRPSLLAGHSAVSAAPEQCAAIVEQHSIHHTILTNKMTDTYSSFNRTYGFVKNVQGIIPKLLQHLLKARKVAKRAMAEAKDDFEISVQNGRQLALKVSCNSVYGFFGVGVKRGLMSCKPVAAVTTLKGRAFIEAAKQYVEKSYLGSSVLYGDTDSIMIKWGSGVSVPRAYQLAEESSAAITELLRNGTVEGASKPLLASAASAVTLANEKVYVPFLLIQKKTYAAMKYTLKGKHQPLDLQDFDCSMDLKGIDAVRRDRSKLIKTLSMSVLEALLIKGSLEAAFDTLRDALDLVASHKAPLEWFILSKSLKSTYKTENQPHVRAWKRMQDRGDSDVPEIGTRMPYVIIEASGSQAKNGPLYERTEHPDFVKLQKKKVCAKYYLENAQDVIERLLGPTMQGHKVKSMFSDAIAKANASGTVDLRSFFTVKRQKVNE